MSTAKGYYSIVQYCPDLSRQECVNVGVVLMVPDRLYLDARMAVGGDRIRRFFGRDNVDFAQLEALMASIIERLSVEQGRINSVEDLEKYIATRGNEVVMTPVRFVKVLNPIDQLHQLFERLVGGRQLVRPEKSVRRELGTLFRRAGLTGRIVREDVQVEVPAFHETVRMPFAFQNGQFNLIQPVRFAGLQKDGVITRACRLAVEGESIHATPNPQFGQMKLWLYARFANHQSAELAAVKSILGDKPVRLFTTEQADSMVDEVRQSGHEYTTAGS